MGRKRPVPRDGADELREWRLHVTAVLERLGSRLMQQARDIGEFEYTPQMMAAEADSRCPRGKLVLESAPEYELMAALLFDEIWRHRDSDTALRIFARIAKPPRKETNKQAMLDELLSRMEAASISPKKMAQELATDPDAQKDWGLSGKASAKNILRDLRREKARRKRELQELLRGQPLPPE
jgi:hypothetical protein